MYIEKLSLENFRNIKNETISFSDGVNILTGFNAQGKTNIVEALWLFSACKSFRTNTERDFIRHGCEDASASLLFSKNDRTQTAVQRFHDKKRRELYLNDVKLTTSAFIGNITGVLFFPEHLNLVKEGPDGRRKFIDFAVCQIRPKYFSVLSDYNRVLFQRNSALKTGDAAVLETLDAWDSRLARLGAGIYMMRKRYIKELEASAAIVADEISDGRESLTLEYKSFEKDCENLALLEKTLLDLLISSRDRDLRVGYTTEGVHKDDIEILLNGISARSFGSQGQQRSAVMAMKLAEAELLNSVYDEYPILLFDDVFSELDKNRKAYIIEKIRNKQVIVTACETINDFGHATLFDVSDGSVRPL